jgi:hypothetical protein
MSSGKRGFFPRRSTPFRKIGNNQSGFWRNMYRSHEKSGLRTEKWGLELGSASCSAISHSGYCSPNAPFSVPSCTVIMCPARSSFLSRCYTKIRELALKSQNLQKLYLLVNNSVSRFSITRLKRTRGGKMKDSLAMLLKTKGGKMSVFPSLAMLLKKQVVICCLSRCL